MTDDIIDEEFQIMDERDEERGSLSSKTFRLPISEIKLKSVVTIDISANLLDAVKLMQKHRIGSLIVTEQGKCAGIITDRDFLLKVVGLITDLANTCVSQVMTKDPIRLMKHDKVAFVMHNMQVGGFRHIPIVNDADEPIAVVSMKDVNRFILDHFPESILNISSTPFRGTSKRWEG